MFCTNNGVVHTGAWVFIWDSARFDFGWRQRDGWRWQADPARPAPFGPATTLAERLGFRYRPFDPTPTDNTWSRSVTFPL